jgi:exosortase
MTSVPVKPSTSEKSSAEDSSMMRVFLPYILAIAAQLPMLFLYFRGLWSRPHYQPFGFAILATVIIAFLRWPKDHPQPFHRSIASDVLLVLGLGFAFLGMLFVEPWFAAVSVMLIVTSLLARTLDKESLQTLWPCSLPLFVYLMLPNGMDVNLITKLQQYSAVYTSRLLDLVGLGHHMDGTLIKVPGVQEYGIEQACSGVQSFFTLLLVAVVFIVLSRRLSPPRIGGAIFAILLAMAVFVLRATVFTTGTMNEFGLLVACGLLLYSALGFRAMALILSAVFWAIFMNTIRIMLIPLSEYFFQYDISSGMRHDILGYIVLAFGILLLFSTDQFLLFLFGPVDANTDESGPLGRLITKIWNSVVSGTTDEDGLRKKRRRGRRPIGASGRTLIWVCSGLMIAMGLWQFFDVQRSLSAREDIQVRFFDSDPTVDFDATDMPQTIGNWTQVDYEFTDRSRASDLGQRSDVWKFQSDRYLALFSLDQPFPGWHELTTCYKNIGWKLVKRDVILPSTANGTQPQPNEWKFVEATFEKETGEKAYMLFSHFDAFGDGLVAPEDWGTISSFMTRAQNRMSHRIRASLFQGEAFQSQVFLTSFNEFPETTKKEVQQQYLLIRDHIRKKFLERKATGGVIEPETKGESVAPEAG